MILVRFRNKKKERKNQSRIIEESFLIADLQLKLMILRHKAKILIQAKVHR